MGDEATATDREFKALFFQCWEMIYKTRPPSMELNENSTNYHAYLSQYDQEFHHWVDMHWNGLDRHVLPYLVKIEKPWEPGLDDPWQLPPRMRTTVRVGSMPGTGRFPPFLVIESYMNDRGVKFDSRVKDHDRKLFNSFWLTLFKSKDKLKDMRDFMSYARYYSAECKKNQSEVARFVFGFPCSANDVWGSTGYMKVPFPSSWDYYRQKGKIYADYMKDFWGKSYGYPAIGGFPVFCEEFQSKMYKYRFPETTQLYYPTEAVLKGFDEWKEKNFNLSLYNPGEKGFDVKLQEFWSRHRNPFYHWLESSKQEGALNYYFCDISGWYGIYNLGFVYDAFFNIFRKSEVAEEGSYEKVWIDKQPTDKQVMDLYERLNIDSYRPIHQYSDNFHYLKLRWMTTFGMYEKTPWMHNHSWGWKPDERSPTKPRPSSPDYWEWMMRWFMEKYPLPNVKYPNIIDRVRIGLQAPKNFGDLPQFEKFLKESKDSDGFWGACDHQWEVYMAWCELNIVGGDFDNYKKPQSLLGHDDGGKPIINIFPDLGVLKNDNPINTPGFWSKIPLTITWDLNFIFGDSWLSAIVGFIEDVFISAAELMVTLAIEGAKIAIAAGSEVAKIVLDFLKGESGKYGIIAIIAVAGFLLLEGAKEIMVNRLS